ncbi:MAG TPA: hypothetical protein P5052_00210 [Candidatus Paceibacterota bacterium]|nr:hypothetical protein [Candidatus Paceibacterota bacterium]HRZ29240.1 hypothetical protein [Candidatus Paceibacterota bacterium]
MTEAKNIKSLIDESKLPPANRQLISEYLSDPDIGIFAKQSLNSKTYFHPDTTLTKNAFVLAIDSIRYNQDYENAIRVLHQSLTNIFYNN